ncbi:MAG: GDSL-type esterase/lipase family protein, partial [Candidatus Woesearchaeota archaeon]
DKKRVEDDWNAMKKNYQNRLGTQIDSAQGKVYKTAEGQFYVFKGSATAITDKVRATYDPLAPVEFYPDGKPYCVPSDKGNFIKILDFFNDGSPKTIQEWNVGTDGRMCTGDDVLIKHNSVLMTAEQNTYYRNLLTIANKFTNKKKGETVTISGKKWVVSDNAAGLKKDSTLPTCYDVMDPNDCQTLFGVCDPVLCPPSRFNLAGNWKVDNVVQTGIIGSLFLGLHNFNPPKEMVPVCLTGISAGLKTIKSVLEGYVQCLNVAYVQGKTVGICDKIRSVYTCEIIWKEALALLKMKGGIMKWITSKISGGGSDGGGEYSKFQDALKNTEASANFFFKEYSATAFASFNARSTQEMGATICQRAIYGKMPKFGKLLDQLATPEDPPQYTAIMSEAPYSETQSLSQYQVYYHIYAGKTSRAPVTTTPGFFGQGGIANTGTNAQVGLDYSVFLKNDLGNVFYITETCQGRRSFIKQGGLADFTVDCVAAKGMNQVCITINGDTKCGFGKVSTSFAINYVNDLIVSEEAKKNIASEEECAPTNPSGSPGVLALASTTQAGIIAPGLLGAVGVASDFASTGIKRICSVNNPGQGTNPLDYKVVGSCGKDSYGNMLGACWIDMRSVSVKNVETMNSVNKVLDEATLKKAKEIAGVVDTLDATKSKARLAELDAQPHTTCRDFYSLVLGYKDLESRSLDPETSGRAQYRLGVALDRLARDKECAKYNPDREFKKLLVEFQNALISLKAQYYKEATDLQEKNKNNPQLSILLSDIASKYGKEMDTSYQGYKSRLAELEKKEGKEVPKFKDEIERIYAEQKQSMVMTGLLKAEVKAVDTVVAQAQRIQCGQCQSSTAGSLFCTSDKCHAINPYCYFFQDKKYLGGVSVDPFNAQCMTCADAKDCSAFNFDMARCNDEGQCKELRGGFACKYIGADGKGMCMPAVNTVQAKAQEKCGECHKGKTGTFSIMMTAVPGSSLCTPASCQSKGDDCYFKQQNGDNLCLPCSMASGCEEMGESFCKNVVCNRAAGKVCSWDAINKKCLTKGTFTPTVPTTPTTTTNPSTAITGGCISNLDEYYRMFPAAKNLPAGYYVSPTPLKVGEDKTVPFDDKYDFMSLGGGVKYNFVNGKLPTFVPLGDATFMTRGGKDASGHYNFQITNYYVADCSMAKYNTPEKFAAGIKMEGSGYCVENGVKYCYHLNINNKYQCNGPEGRTAIGIPAKTKRTIAVNPGKTLKYYNSKLTEDLPETKCRIPYGSYVYIGFNTDVNRRQSGWYIAQDTGGYSKYQRCWIDVFTDRTYSVYESSNVDIWVYPVIKGDLPLCSNAVSTVSSIGDVCSTVNGKKIAAVGDSLTAYKQPGEYVTYQWPDQIKNRCTGVTIQKVGKTEIGTATMLSTYKSSNIYKTSDIIIIMGGMNDNSVKPNVENTKSNLQQMYDLAKQNGKYVVAITITPWKGYNEPKYPQYDWTAEKQVAQDQINAWIKSEAKNVDVVVDGYQVLGDSTDPQKVNSLYEGGDHMHFNTAGHRALANEVLSRIFNPIVADVTSFGLTDEYSLSSEPENEEWKEGGSLESFALADAADISAFGMAEEYTA